MCKNIVRLISSMLCFFVVLGFSGINSVHALDINYDYIIDQETAWIASLQFENGAIPTYSQPLAHYNNKYRVVPYFANIAAMALLEKPQYINNAKKYMDWYFSHLNWPDYNGLYGTVYDYDVDADRTTEHSRNSYDSVDSYAATFISLARRYYEVSGDAQYLIDHRYQLDIIGGAIINVKHSDGLTWAKPEWKIKYTMDNCEVFTGLRDIEWIFRNVYGDTGAADWYAIHKNNVVNGIQAILWDTGISMYSVGIDQWNQRISTQWQIFYPGATAQLFPIWTGTIFPYDQRAADMYVTFNYYHPRWHYLDTSDDFPWALIAYTGAIMSDKTRVDQFLNEVLAYYIYQGHPWPWYCMEAGFTILAAKKAKSL